MLKLSHTADSHLDASAYVWGKPILGSDGRNVRAVDRVRCFQSVVDGAIARGCNLFLHAGDVFERNKPTPAEYCDAEALFDQVTSHMPCVVCADNHSAVESVTERHGIEPLSGRHPRLYVSVRPELLTIETAAGRVQVATLPSPKRSVVAGKDEYRGLSPAAINALISDKLRAIIQGFRARLDPALPSILMIHGQIAGAWLNDLRQSTGTQDIALLPEDLDGWTYAALGDYHRPQQVTPRAAYAGSSDRTDSSQEHQAVGWLYVELDGAGALPRIEQVETPARRYITYAPEDLATAPIEPLHSLDIGSPDYPIVRCTGRVSQEAYDTLRPVLAQWREIPTFSDQLEVSRTTRARNEHLTAELDDEAALREWHASEQRGEDVEELVGEYRRCVELMGVGK
jgi:DNA repair exonuclease SbcCD nuclease subunit